MCGKTCYSITPVKNVFYPGIRKTRWPENRFFKVFRAGRQSDARVPFHPENRLIVSRFPRQYLRVLSVIADPVGFQSAVIKNHYPDLPASGKCPHAIVIGFLHVPEMIPGKIILNIRKE